MKRKLAFLGLLLFVCVVLYAATGDESITLTSFVDDRNTEPELRPVWELVITATHDADDTGDVTQAIVFNGILQKIIFTVPDYSNGITGQLVVKDNGDHTIFDTGEKAEGGVDYFYNLSEPLTGTIDIVMGVSGVAGGTGASMIATLRGI